MKMRLLLGLVGIFLVLSSHHSFLQQPVRRTVVTEARPVFLVADSSRTPLRVLAAGTPLRILKTEGDWLQVEFDDPNWGRRVGYIRKDFVHSEAEAAIEAQAAAGATVEQPRTTSGVMPDAGGGKPAGGAEALDTPSRTQPPGVQPVKPTVQPDSGTPQGNAGEAAAKPAAGSARADIPPGPRAREEAGPGTPTLDKPRTDKPKQTQAKVKNLKIRGYVTAITSPTEFEIEDYRITRDAGFVLDVQNASDEVRFQLNDLRVGMELEIKGQFDESTGELRARSITVDMEQFKKVRHTAVLSQLPEGIERTDQGWTGLCFADGQRIRIGPGTQVVFGLTKRERDIVKLREQAKKKAAKSASANEEDIDFEPLGSLEQVKLGMVMTYEGTRNREDGVIEAERIEFVHNDLEKGEKQLWDSLKVQSKPFDAAQLRPGELRINRIGKFKTLPDSGVHEYVAELGERLIPAYQRELAADDPDKIPFRFFVVMDKNPNAFATPNGIIVIHSGLFGLLENEAQLAFILGHEIAHSMQKHTWRQREYHKKKLMALQIGGAVAAAFGQYAIRDMATLVEAAVRNGYSRNLENQADRLGLEYVVNAGYDPRQAPAVWKVIARRFGNAPTDFFWSTHENHATRRSYLMNELKNNYEWLDYSELTTEEPSFKEMAERVRVAEDPKRRIKVR
jgi:hypothetical protein